MKKIMKITSVALLLVALLSCRENAFGVVDLTLPEEEPKVEYIYNHPCGMYNEADFARVKALIATRTGAAYEEFVNLRDFTNYSKIPYTPTPQTQIVRGDWKGTDYTSENYAYAMRDAAAAYQQALLWKLTGEEEYATSAVNILNQWAAVCKAVKSNDSNHFLAAGCQGYTFANAAELLRDYEGWAAADFDKFKAWMLGVFAERNLTFLTEHCGQSNSHYWANWDLVNLASYFAIGVLTESDDLVSYVVNYFYNGVGNGCLKQLIINTHADPLETGETIAQCQESGRDQGHATMVAAVAANLCQMAYTLYLCNPEMKNLDFFAAENNAILRMCEYTALFNVKDGTDKANALGSYLISVSKMPFTPYLYNPGHSTEATHTQASEDGRGAARPGWEIIYNHYAKVKGLSSGYIYSKKFADKLRPEGGSGDSRYGVNSSAFDQLGWGTLMMHRE